MKRKSNGGGWTGKSSTNKMKMKGSLATHLTVQIGRISFKPPINKQGSSSISLPNPFRFQNLLDSEAQGAPEAYPSSSTATLDVNADVSTDDETFILSQDFFCTPDYITPEVPLIPNTFTFNKQEDIPCPRSPEKVKTVKSKRQRQGLEHANENLESDEIIIEETAVIEPLKNQGYVSQSAVALRCRVMPPPCMRNPYLKNSTEDSIDPFGNRRSKCEGFLSAFVGGEGLSRYGTDFHEIEQIGNGNFSRVFKALKRIDGCMYAVKKCTRQLHQDNERLKALMEVQALASLGFHENVVGYYTSWFENEQLYIQMELCDHSLSVNQFHKLCPEGEVLEAMHQIAKALQFIHEKGVAHLDLKPENIYVKNGVYKLGDFGCATLLDKSLPIEEGDARYMPQEILNDNYDHLDKVDIFSLGASIYELVKGSTLPESGPHFLNLREGKLPLLPGRSVQFQNLLKAMMDPDPVRRPSAKELVENPIFERRQRTTTTNSEDA